MFEVKARESGLLCFIRVGQGKNTTWRTGTECGLYASNSVEWDVHHPVLGSEMAHRGADGA